MHSRADAWLTDLLSLLGGLFLCSRQLLRVRQVIDSDGKKYVQQRILVNRVKYDIVQDRINDEIRLIVYF